MPKPARDLVFDKSGFEDLAWWIANNRKMALKIIKIIKEIRRSPYEGLSKPEKLKHALLGCYSRRIDSEHRLVYQILDDSIRILACRYHY